MRNKSNICNSVTHPKFSKEDNYYMQHALTLATIAKHNNEVPVGAIIVVQNEIIATGYNQPIKTKDPTAHAEIIAIRQACQKLNNYRLNNATIYVTLEPCQMCINAIRHARINKLIFGAFETNKPLNHYVQTHGGLFECKAVNLLVNFFKERR